MPNEPEYTVATVAAMREFEAAHPRTKANVEPLRAVCLDVRTGATYSGTSGDYFMRPETEPLTNEHDEPLLLAVPFSGYRDALTGELI